MKEKKETKLFFMYARKTISKTMVKKIRKIKDYHEQMDALKYAIKSGVDMKYHELSKKLDKSEERKKDVFFARAKFRLLGFKIKLFEATYGEEDFNNIQSLFRDVEKEMKNV